MDRDPAQGMQTANSDLVSLEFDGSVAWTSPLSAEFTEFPRIQQAYPTGVATLTTRAQPTRGKMGRDGEDPIVDGEQVTSRCSLKASSVAPSGMVVQISRHLLTRV